MVLLGVGICRELHRFLNLHGPLAQVVMGMDSPTREFQNKPKNSQNGQILSEL